MNPTGEARRWRSWWPSALVGGVCGVTYVTTAAPGLVWGDSIELAAVCATLGIAHPTGYPLFTLIGHLFTYLPWGTIPFRVTLFCALSMACSVGLMEQWLWRWMGGRRIATMAGALAFGWCLGPWTHATRTEVYALQLVFQSLILLQAFDAVQGHAVQGPAFKGQDLATRTPNADSLAFPATVSFLMGLGFSHHLLTLVLLPLWSVVLWRCGRQVPSRLRFGSWQVLAFGFGLLPILYLPLRAQQFPPVDWGHPADLESLWWTLSGGDFPDDLFLVEQPGSSFTVSQFVVHLGERGRSLVTYLVGMVVPLTGLPLVVKWLWTLIAGGCLGRGVWQLRRRVRGSPGGNQGLWLASVAGLALYLGILFTYNIGDITDYQLGFFALLWPMAWWGGWLWIEDWKKNRSRRHSSNEVVTQLAPRTASLALCILPLALLVGNFALADRSDEVLVDRLAERLLRDLPPHSILLTQGDFSTATAWYRQAVLEERPDVLVFCLDFFYEDWYGELMARKLRTDPALEGLQVATSTSDGERGEPFLEALDRLVVAPNADTPIMILPSPRQARALARRFEVSMEYSLLDGDELAEFELAGWHAPQPILFRIRSRESERQPHMPAELRSLTPPLPRAGEGAGG